MNQKNSCRFALAAVMIGLFSGVSLFAQAAPAPAPAPAGPIQPAKIGVINMDQIFNKLQEANDIRTKQQQEQDALRNTAQDHKTELDRKLETRNKSFKPGSPQYVDATRELQKLQMQYEMDLKLGQSDMGRRQNQLMKSVYDKIEAASSDIAHQRGLDLIISQVRPEFPENVEDQNPDAIRGLIQQRTLIFVSPNIDVTNEVIARLDANYKAAGSSK